MNSHSVSALADLTSLWPWWLSSMLKATVWLGAWLVLERAWHHRSSSACHVMAVLAAFGLPVIFAVNVSPHPEQFGWQPLAPVWETATEQNQPADLHSRPGAMEIAHAPASGMNASGLKQFSWPGVVLAIWGAGVLACWLGLVFRSWPRRVSGKIADPTSDGHVVRAVERECAQLGVAGRPRVRLVFHGTPRLSGLWQPTLELPEAASEWSDGKLSAVLRHELAHLRRSDLRWLVATEAALALIWGHPLRGVLRRRLARLREEACDDIVIAAGMEPTVYATHLASFLSVSKSASRAWSLPAVELSGWPGRFRRVLDCSASRSPACKREIIMLSVVSAAVVSVGTLCVGCLGTREVLPDKSLILSPDPVPPPKLRAEARKLNIELKVWETTVRPREAAKLGFPNGFASAMGRVLTADEARKVFLPGRSELRFATASKPTRKPGQELKIESARPVRYPVEFLPNSRTGVLEPSVYEEQKVGVFLNITVWPTQQPDRIMLEYRFSLKDHEGQINHSPAGFVQPVFSSRMISDEMEMVNGSFIVVGYKSSTQKLAGFVPHQANEAQYRRWLREASGGEYGRLAAVQVIVVESGE